MALTVMVGSDGSEHSLAAVGWAARAARRRSAPLYVIVVGSEGGFSSPLSDSRRQRSLAEDFDRRACEEIGAAAVARARAEIPDLTAEVRAVPGDPVDVLSGLSEHGILVVGARGMGGVAGVFAGSVSRQVAARSRGPVVVVGDSGGTDLPPRVVAGVADDASCIPVALFAAEHASLAGLPLHFLHAADGTDMPPGIGEAVRHAETRVRGIPVTAESVTGSAADALIGASRDASLIVVGTRGRRPLTGLVLGSVSQSLLTGGHCPAAIVPPGAAVA